MSDLEYVCDLCDDLVNEVTYCDSCEQDFCYDCLGDFFVDVDNGITLCEDCTSDEGYISNMRNTKTRQPYNHEFNINRMPVYQK